MWKGRMAVSGTVKCMGWLYAVLLLVLAVQTFKVLILFISAIKEPAQPARLVFGL